MADHFTKITNQIDMNPTIYVITTYFLPQKKLIGFVDVKQKEVNSFHSQGQSHNLYNN